MTRFSCIIPAYNMEQYLERCVFSLSKQRFKDIEILIIDDGSLDDTFLLAQKIASKDGRVRVFHQKNAGQGSARNHGLREAKGEYIWFVDR
jgi:glycosyltransferase involved in cell wall biosynthesis